MSADKLNLQIHTVQFSNANKIQQIRVFWDQGALLKQVDVIGSRGRNWPIYDNKDQARLVKSSAGGALHAGSHSESHTDRAARGRDPEEVVVTARNASPNKKHIRDPHSSLDLFDPHEAEKRQSSPAAIAPRASARPPPRDMSDLFVGNESEATPTKAAAPVTTEPPASATAPKGAGGKKFAANRLFEEDPDAETPAKYKSHPKKYNHFDLGNGEPDSTFDDPKAKENKTSKPSSLRPKTTQQSHWDFEDFNTPDKPKTKARGQDQRHFGWSDDEGELVGSPGKHPHVPQPRRDAETHFEFQDDGSPAGMPAGPKPFGRPKGQAHNTGLGLYQNNLWEDGMENYSTNQDFKKPLTNLPNGANRSKDFGHSWDYMEQSPEVKKKVGDENKPMAGDHMKAVKMMNASWDSYESPDQKATRPPKADRKGTESHWGFGE